jgi:hypothetical protein
MDSTEIADQSRPASELTIGHARSDAVQLTVESDDLIGCDLDEDMVSPLRRFTPWTGHHRDI